jgi:hypothetical protein
MGIAFSGQFSDGLNLLTPQRKRQPASALRPALHARSWLGTTILADLRLALHRPDRKSG